MAKKNKTVLGEISDDKRFKPNFSVGLTDEQIKQRISQNLVNAKSKQMTRSAFKIICANLFTFFNLLCILCLIALISVGETAPGNYFFVIIYAINLSLSIFQEIRAKRAIEKLSILNEPTAKVLRNGSLTEISVTDLVIDDVVSFSSGNQISIDGTVVEGQMEVNESMLTGESVPVKKVVGDKILSGSFVVSGTALAITDKVGEARYIQKLSAKAKKFKKPNSEIMNTLRWIIKIIGLMIIPIFIGTLLTNYNHILTDPESIENGFIINEALSHEGIKHLVTKSVSVIIGMIPAGMFLLTTLALAVGVLRLAKRNTSVQDMYSLEMLARVDVLCLDKTGTITDGKMKVTSCVLFDGNAKNQVKDVIATMQHALPDNNQTALALKRCFGVKAKYESLEVIPFSSQRKYSAVTLKINESAVETYALGAPEFILKEENITDTLKKQLNHYTSLGQRVLLLARSNSPIVDEELPLDMTAFALITLSDNIRKEAIKTIEWFKKNGVQVKVISGDNPMTVSEVATRAGIEGADKYVSLDGMSDDEVKAIANKYNVFGRVTPEQKALLIQSIKAEGHTVAMTGDGVNDILAMKEADCSVTVASGSDATKSISHIVLMDNNFDSMPEVVGEGRRVINNIKKSSALFLMKTLFTTTFAIISILRQTLFPFDSQMMMMLEVMVIGIGSFALSMEANRKKVSGKFVSYIFSHSIPGACILILNILVYELIGAYPVTPELTFEMKETFMVGALTVGGLAFMHIICKPYNLYRGCLITALSLIVSLLLAFGMGFFQLPNIIENFTTNWPFIVILACLVQFDISFGSLLTKLIEYINHSAIKRKMARKKKKSV